MTIPPTDNGAHTGQSSIGALQEVLMHSLRDVRAGTLDATRARAVNDLAQTLINSAKVEIDFLRATKRTHSSFLEGNPAQPTPTSQGTAQELPPGSPWRGLVHRTGDE